MIIQEEDTDATAVAVVNQLAGEAKIDECAQTIEFTTQDGQKVRFVPTSYPDNTMQLGPEFVTIGYSKDTV